MAAIPSQEQQQEYYFIPHMGVQQLPQSPFSWSGGSTTPTEARSKCTAETTCLGYDSAGNAVTSDILAAERKAKFSFHDSPDYGFYLKDERAFKTMCEMGQGTPQGMRCQIAPETARNSLMVLAGQGKLVKENFWGGSCSGCSLLQLLLWGAIIYLAISMFQKQK